MHKPVTTLSEDSNVTLDEQAVEMETSVGEQVADATNDESSEAYNNAWDNLDVNDMETLNSIDDSTEEVAPLSDEVQSPDLLDDSNPTEPTANNSFMFDKPVLKYKGSDITIDTPEELIALAQKGFKMESAMADIKPMKRVSKIVSGVPEDVLQAVADLHSGNADAINFINEKYGIKKMTDSEDIWSDNENSREEKKSTYTPDVKTESPLDEFWSELTSTNVELAGEVNKTYSGLDESFKKEIYTDGMFQSFVTLVESGEFARIYPMAVKEKTLNSALNWIQAYSKAVAKVDEKNTQSEPPVEIVPPRSVNTPRTSELDAADKVWNDPDYFNELEAKIFS